MSCRETGMPLTKDEPCQPIWTTLPREILRTIASTLAQRDLRSARSTCRDWLHMVQGMNQKSWEVSGSDVSDVESWEADVLVLTALAPSIQHVQLTLSAMASMQLDRWLNRLQKMVPQLATLHLSFETCSGLRPSMLYSLSSLPYLTQLSIKASGAISTSPGLLLPLGSLTQLTSLQLSLRCFSPEPLEMPLTLLAPLKQLRRCAISKRHDYGSAYVAVPWSRAEVNALGPAWSQLEELELTLNVLDYYRPGLSALSVFTGLRHLRLAAVEGFAQLEWVWLNLLLLPRSLQTLHVDGMVLDLPEPEGVAADGHAADAEVVGGGQQQLAADQEVMDGGQGSGTAGGAAAADNGAVDGAVEGATAGAAGGSESVAEAAGQLSAPLVRARQGVEGLQYSSLASLTSGSGAPWAGGVGGATASFESSSGGSSSSIQRVVAVPEQQGVLHQSPGDTSPPTEMQAAVMPSYAGSIQELQQPLGDARHVTELLDGHPGALSDTAAASSQPLLTRPGQLSMAQLRALVQSSTLGTAAAAAAPPPAAGSAAAAVVQPEQSAQAASVYSCSCCQQVYTEQLLWVHRDDLGGNSGTATEGGVGPSSSSSNSFASISKGSNSSSYWSRSSYRNFSNLPSSHPPASPACTWCKEAVRPTPAASSDGRIYYMPPEYKALGHLTCSCKKMPKPHQQPQNLEGLLSGAGLCPGCSAQQAGSSVAAGASSSGLQRGGGGHVYRGSSSFSGRRTTVPAAVVVRSSNSFTGSLTGSSSSTLEGSNPTSTTISMGGGNRGLSSSVATTSTTSSSSSSAAGWPCLDKQVPSFIKRVLPTAPLLRSLSLDSCRLSDSQLLHLAKCMSRSLTSLGLLNVRGLTDAGLMGALPRLLVLESLEVMTVSPAAGGGGHATSSLTLTGLWAALGQRSSRQQQLGRTALGQGTATTAESGFRLTNKTVCQQQQQTDDPAEADDTQQLRDQQPHQDRSQQQQQRWQQSQVLPAPQVAASSSDAAVALQQLLWTCDAWTLELSSAAAIQEEMEQQLLAREGGL